MELEECAPEKEQTTRARLRISELNWNSWGWIGELYEENELIELSKTLAEEHQSQPRSHFLLKPVVWSAETADLIRQQYLKMFLRSVMMFHFNF